MENKPTDSSVDKVFNRFDEDGDGKISASELGNVVRAIGSDVTDHEVAVMMQEMDKNRDGFVDKSEFAEFNRIADAEADADADADLKDAFDMYDLNGNGLISSKELHLVMGKLGEKCSVEDCARMIGSVDADGDGFVNFEEFKRMMKKGEASIN